MTKAIAYLRTSTATNEDGDSSARQRAAITAYAGRAEIELAAEFYDVISGTTPIEARPAFRAMLDRIASNGVRLVIVEDATRLARDVLVQEMAIHLLRSHGVKLVTASGVDLTDCEDPSRNFIRQVLGASAQFEKSKLVLQLRAARVRKAAATGKPCGGRKSYADARPEVVAMIRDMRASEPSITLAAIGAKLTEAGLFTGTGKPLSQPQLTRICKANGIGKGARE